MRRIRTIFLLIIALLFSMNVRADEGMWLLSLLNGYTIEDMQKEGFKLSAEDIYSVNQACIKDAVVIFGGGCTGELISDQGLVLTNHHCGYGAIQAHSSVDKDYLTDGFWAMSREEELPNPSLSVRFLKYMDDVTERIEEGITDEMGKETADNLIRENIQNIQNIASEEGKYEALVRPLYYGNEYYIFVYERYSDVRLVGAPPSSIGNFGEDNDNWIWPRHTGDFSIFRIYANAENGPASYSPDNKPYTPKKSFEISLNGVEEGDFTMVLGYPGSTQQFLYSDALEILTEQSLPLRIEARTKRLEIMDEYMRESDLVRIQYASKYRGVSNAWKKWQGVIRGLDRLDAINVKHKEEAEFLNWISASPEREKEYGDLFPLFEDIYGQLESTGVLMDLSAETISAIEMFRLARSVERLMETGSDVEKIKGYVTSFYKDYHHDIDKDVFASMMSTCYWYMENDYQPPFFDEVRKKYNGDFTLFSEKVYESTVFRSSENLNTLIEMYQKNPDKALRKLKNEQLVQYVNQFVEIYNSGITPHHNLLQSSLNSLYKLYVKGLMEMKPDHHFYPDANFSMRLTYGKVEGYEPLDAVHWRYYTTLQGVMEKSKMGKKDYEISEKLVELYNDKDYGRYGSGSYMPVCFAASNHTSGGNSGSPVINGEGRLIGINFDRNWEGTMSDEMYDPDQCRNISVDIRYVMFVIDKFAGAGYLLDEMVFSD